MKYLLTPLLLLLLFCSGNPQHNIETRTTKIVLKEASGIAVSKASHLFWVVEDSGNENIIYGLDHWGRIMQEIRIGNAKNVDWEDLASDTDGNLYIGDFGNNDNDRRDLCIYKIEAPSLQNTKANAVAKTSFHYPEQRNFPPKKSEFFYDAESFFEYKGHFYIFTKNRSKGFDGTVLLYKVPNKDGQHPAAFLGEFISCGNFNKCAITGADISPDGKTIALLSSGRVWLISDFLSDDFLQGKMEMFELNDVTQKEGICFKDNETLLIVDEKSKKTGGNLYEIKLAALKTKS